jgi:PAS domain S-box-containing protein
MSAVKFDLNDQSLAIIDELGGHMPGGFFIYKAEAPEELLYANKPVFDIYGCDSLEDFKELTGYTFKGMVHPDDYERISQSIVEQIETNEDHMDYAEYRIIRKDGVIRWVDDYGHYLNTEEYGGIYTVFINDVTEKYEALQSHLAKNKAAMEALQDSFRKAHAERLTFNRIARALAADYFCIYVVDPDTEDFVEYSSSEEYDQFGIDKAGSHFFAVSRKNMSRLIHPEDRERFLEVFNKDRVLSIIARDGIFTTKYRLMINGVPTYISMKASILEDEDGCHLIIGTNNIDAQMRREQEYQKRVAEAKLDAKNDFLANMSHDIRTPMNAIIGYTNIANTHVHNPRKVKESLEKIGSSSHFLLSLINDILDISKIESGKMQLTYGPCDLGDIFRRIEDITALQARNKSLHITYDHSNIRHFEVNTDELRLEQIIINIVGNAIKYTPEGKDVFLIAEEERVPGTNRNKYRFIIRDTGIGISEDYLPYIFESFTREQSTKINRVQGTGLGLAITGKIVELMGGTISVKSKPGEGSEFIVEVEMECLEAIRDDDFDEDEEIDLAGYRVLLVEDIDINAEIAIMILEQYGVITNLAKNGQVGVDMIRNREEDFYQAILMDIQMPVMNGYEATRAIRAMDGDYYKNIPIIAMSANAYSEDVEACLEAGMNAHLAKPFSPHELMKLLYNHIG